MRFLFLMFLVLLSHTVRAQEDIPDNFDIGDSIFNTASAKCDFAKQPAYSALYKENEYMSGHYSFRNQLKTYSIDCEVKYSREQTSVNTEPDKKIAHTEHFTI